MTDSSILQPLSSLLTQLSTESTIYRRHETRRAQSLALKDDPRHPAVRVLSLLPGSSLFVPKYEPDFAVRHRNEPSSTGKFSKETISDSMEGDARKSHVHASDEQQQPKMGWSQSRHFPTILTTGATTAVAHLMLPSHDRQTWNPFLAAPSLRQTTSTIASGRIVSSSPASTSMGANMTTISHDLWMMGSAQQYRLASMMVSHVPATAISVGLLFGTRDALAPSYGSLLASGVAGILASLPTWLHQAQPLALVSVNLPLHLARHTIGGALYFGVYEYTRRGRDSTFQTAVAGTLAGVVWTTMTSPRTVWRAAPVHGLLWCVYEEVSDSIRSASRLSVTPES